MRSLVLISGLLASGGLAAQTVLSHFQSPDSSHSEHPQEWTSVSTTPDGDRTWVPVRQSATTKTIYEALSEDKDYTIIFTLINENPKIAKLLNDPSASITFFAPRDTAFPTEKGDKDSQTSKEINPEPPLASDPRLFDSALSAIRKLGESARALQSGQPVSFGDGIERHAPFSDIIGHFFSYHILQENSTLAELVEKATHATGSTILSGASNAEALRLHIRKQHESEGSSVLINRYSQVTSATQAANGYVYGVDRTLMLPPSTFQEIFGCSEFSLLASAIQFTGLREVLDDTVAKSSSNVAATFFAPTDMAFGLLPVELCDFLFSNRGRRALKRLLKLHIVPNTVLFSDHMYDAKQHTQIKPSDLPSRLERKQLTLAEEKANQDIGLIKDHREQFIDPFAPSNSGSTEVNGTLDADYIRRIPSPEFSRPSWNDVRSNSTVGLVNLLPGYFLKIVRTEFKASDSSFSYTNTLQINGVLSTAPDIITRNGVIHVVPELFHPFKPSGVYRDLCVDEEPFDGPPYVTHSVRWLKPHCITELWEDWENWLERWAMNDD